jgi:Tectonin domain
MNRRMLLLAASILCWAAAILPASARHFKQIPGSLAQIAAGRSEVWGLDPSSAVYRFSSGTKTFARVGTIKLSRIAVGGGSALQPDQVWGINPSGKVYKFNFKNNAFNLIAGSLAQIVVGEGDFDKCHPYEVWGLNAAELIYRYNYCTSQFDQIAGSLTVIATGGGEIWGLNSSAQIYEFYWYTNEFTQVPGSLQQITVGASDVWGLDGDGNVYQFDNVNRGFAVSRGTVGWHSSQIAAGGDGVWGLFFININDPRNTWRLNSSGSELHFPFPGLSQIAVGYGAGVWGLDSAHHVYAFVRP